MYNTTQHSDLSHAIANTFDTALRNSAAVRWNDLIVASPLPEHPDFGVVVQGAFNMRGEKGFSISLRQNFNEETWGKGNELMGAFAPLGVDYRPLGDTLNKMQDYLLQSLRESVKPIHTEGAFSGFSKDIMQPLLDALNANDFALAAELTPSQFRLCGYQEFSEEYEYTTYGHGWTGQYETTLIAPGRYPVFASEYTFIENEDMYANYLKDFRGLNIYLAGKCTDDSVERSPEAYPFDNFLFASPYCHAAASNILDGNSSIHLFPPFKAVAVDFEYLGESHRTHHIVDESLPVRMKQSPMTFRNKSLYIRKTLNMSEDARKLYDRFLREYTNSIGSMCNNSQIPMHYLIQDKNYSPEALRELLDSNIIQHKPGEIEAYELTAKERLDLFHTDQMKSKTQYPLKWQEEYDRCVKESKKKAPLSCQIQTAAGLMAGQKQSALRNGVVHETGR